jgi:abequosyltransferase
LWFGIKNIPMIKKLISICIPAYNRPDELYRLLNSIDSKQIEKIEIIICEDKSPKRNQINQIVSQFIDESDTELKYFENQVNLGYDRNLRELIKESSGKFIVFMGDDDTFVPNALDKLINFLSKNEEIGYVLKSHNYYFSNGKVENFRYFDGDRFFPAGENTYIELFRKSVFISGFVIQRNYIQNYMVDEFDGTLLFQLYILSEVALKYQCAYFDTPLTQAKEGGIPFFGSSESEKGLYTPGDITINNSINFLKSFFKITKFIDKKYSLSSTAIIKKDMSKYFYPSLAIQKHRGLKEFYKYIKELGKIGFNCTIYYYIYIIMLVFFGKNICDGAIVLLKRIIGRTPRL